MGDHHYKRGASVALQDGETEKQTEEFVDTSRLRDQIFGYKDEVDGNSRGNDGTSIAGLPWGGHHGHNGHQHRAEDVDDGEDQGNLGEWGEQMRL